MQPEARQEEALEWVLNKLAAAKKPTAVATPAPKISREQKLHEVDLWRKWKEGGEKPKDLDPLLKSMSGIIYERVNKFRRAEVPSSAIIHEHKKEFVKSLRTWDPDKGSLSTWLGNTMKRAGRYVETYKNPARITENISQHIGSFKAVKSELAEKLGHEPDAHAIHDYVLKIKHPTLGILSLKDITRVEREQRKTFLDKGHDSEETGASPLLASRQEEVAYLIIPSLTPQERLVHEYTLGLNGKQQLKPGQIAKKLKMDNSKVAKLRTSIFNKMRPFLGE